MFEGRKKGANIEGFRTIEAAKNGTMDEEDESIFYSYTIKLICLFDDKQYTMQSIFKG